MASLCGGNCNKKEAVKKEDETIKENWQDFAEVTTLHGLRGTSRKGVSPVQRILWVVILFGMFGLYIGLASNSISSYIR